MPTVGPELPPHLTAKRKRPADEEGDQAASDRRISRSRSSSSDGGQKRPWVIGPSLPPAALDELPTLKRNLNAESDSDDDFGPAPPPAAGKSDGGAQTFHDEAFAAEEQARNTAKKLQREEWMLVPPKQDDWSSRVDPTKLKNRKFNTGKGAKGPAQKGGTDSTLWTETPMEKRKRLEDEVMGVKKPAHLDQGSHNSATNSAEAKETEKRISDYNERHRNSSLYEEHKKATPKEEEDDPSKRAFDKEKDIRGGMKIDHGKKKELLSRAADFGSRFAKGSYL